MRNPFLHSKLVQRPSLSTYLKFGPNFIAPFYHAVSDEPLPHIRHLYKVKTVSEFEEDLDFMLRYYEPISVDELITDEKGAVFYEDGRPLIHPSRPKMLLSFDDGLRSFYEVVAPILQKKGVPCICFINSGFVDNKALFYRYQESLNIEYKGGVDVCSFLKEEQPYLTTPQIESLIKEGFCFGGHSINHPLYTTLSLEAQLEQTLDSCRAVSQIAGSVLSSSYPCYFSFPFTDTGVSLQFFQQISSTVSLSFGTAGLKLDLTPRHIQRIPMELGRPMDEKNPSVAEILKGEYAYYIAKKFLFKNTINRK